MFEREPSQQSAPQDAFGRNVGAQETRKLRTARNRVHVWSGLGGLGVIGWSIAGPTLLGTFLGVWLDRRHPGGRSWTMALLVTGLCIGCASAWHWIVREEKAIHRDGDGR